ncbi:MerR family transcriptional regulator [Methylobacterium fujisawaense]|uniref:MerR family transcriptional regulator n=1 Tax=Methylobacterium fujisawaense TaxID=107400 RepID=UPI0031F5ABF2
MESTQIESWSFGRNEAADLVGMSSVQVGNYLKRYDLFPGRPRGKGYHVSFKLRDLLKLAAVKALIESGLTPEQAAEALRNLQSPLDAMMHDGYGKDQEPAFTYPGTMFFTRNADGHWIAADGPDKVVCIQIRCWPLFDDLWPRVRAKIREESTPDFMAPYPGDVEAGIAAFEAEIAKIRAQRWGKEA